MNVLFLAAEAAPLVKVGGLGDVAGELPRALRGLGIDVRLAIPRYPQLADHSHKRSRGRVVDVPRASGALPAEIHETTLRGVPTWLIGGEPIDRAPTVYGDEAVDASKFLFFVIGALQACEQEGWYPDIVHANDWHTAPALAWMRTAGIGRSPAATLLTIHNLAYMGAGGSAALSEYGIPPANHPLLPDWARTLPLPVGMAHADAITAVSPGYAAEIQTPEFGCGLEAFLASRATRLRGILNGIDHEVWDPARDASLLSPYERDSIGLRAANKADLQRALGLRETSRTPLLAMITRLDMQKGVDLALEALSELGGSSWQIVILGTGDPALEQRAAAFTADDPERSRFLPTFDAELARRIYAGADMLLVPSRYEPCGLVQMISMRYGAVPVVRATGGLKDTVVPFTPDGRGTGFVFDTPQPRALAESIAQAIDVYGDTRAWRALQRRGMAQDFSWGRSAQAYADLYVEIASARSSSLGGGR